jgi:hypothetical protein
LIASISSSIVNRFSSSVVLMFPPDRADASGGKSLSTQSL